MTALPLPYACGAGEKRGKVMQRRVKPTLTPFGLNHAETLRFILRDGGAWEMTLQKTSAEVAQRNGSGITAYAFDCDVEINGKADVVKADSGMGLNSII